LFLPDSSEEIFLVAILTNIPDKESPKTISKMNAGYLAYLESMSIEDKLIIDIMITIINMVFVMKSLYATCYIFMLNEIECQ